MMKRSIFYLKYELELVEFLLTCRPTRPCETNSRDLPVTGNTFMVCWFMVKKSEFNLPQNVYIVALSPI